ncbi:CD48 antigen [Taeniopygia guttata]|uniref:CD48 antigen n=1 Tax=Taeniopygia guttata TaxID=59729 RepID=UPI003BB97A31
MAPGLTRTLLLFLLFPARAWAGEPQTSQVTGAVGGVALLNPRSPQNPSKYSQIHWRWENELRIASCRPGEQPSYPRSRFWGRLELLENATLRVSQLGLADSGEYHLYLEDDTGRESVEKVRLKVYDLVPKPHVVATTNGDPWQCNATLSCSVGLQEVTYEWITPQKPLMKEGPVLKVSFNPVVETYVCKVSNPVSSSNASLTFHHPCSWTDESSSVACATPSGRVALGAFVLLFLLLSAA